ncbi:MAG: AbrB/MazE/SpoVT family DNA-binding domain-containing protein [Bacillota bacterium]|jgi:AbrB family looped-hinge helix DNA binding protein
MEKDVWNVKVTSKGQITLPKRIRDLMFVREGDHLQATLKDESIVLTRSSELPDSAKIRLDMAMRLREMGIDPHCSAELKSPHARQRIPGISPDMTERIRAQRDGRDDVFSPAKKEEE